MLVPHRHGSRMNGGRLSVSEVCNYTDKHGWRAMNSYDGSFGVCSDALRDSAKPIDDIDA